MVFTFASNETPASKCYVSHGCLPRSFHPKELPSKKKPFATILNQPFTHSVRALGKMQRYSKLKCLDQVDLLLPEELYDLIWNDVEAGIANIRYSRVIMSLSDLLESDFFNTYIKTGIFIFLFVILR